MWEVTIETLYKTLTMYLNQTQSSRRVLDFQRKD